MSDIEKARADFFALRQDIFNHIESGKEFQRQRRTVKRLQALKHDDWNIDWSETMIAFNCYRREKPARTHGMLSRLRTLCEEKGESARFDEFFGMIKSILHPLFITPHGFCTTFSERPADEILSSLDEVLDPLFQSQQSIILYAGALLGYIRNGALIGHDDDIDVAVFLGEQPLEDVAEIWRAYKIKLHNKGLIAPVSISDSGASFKLENRQGVDVDLFPCWTTNGRFSVYPYSFDALETEAIFPLKPFRKTRLKLPNDPEALLRQSYGESWKIPDPLFHFDWPAAKRQFRLLCNKGYSL